MIDAAAWLAARSPVPPAELSDRLYRITAGQSFGDTDAMSRFFIGEAESLLSGLRDDRSGALDLLVADSLITYALEAAAGDCGSLESIAAEAIERIAMVSSRGGNP